MHWRIDFRDENIAASLKLSSTAKTGPYTTNFRDGKKGRRKTM